MYRQHATHTEPENMEKAEGVLRGVLGLALIEAIVLIPTLSEAALAVITAASIYIGLTAVTRWDPIYALLRLADAPTASAPLSVTADSKRHDNTESATVQRKAA